MDTWVAFTLRLSCKILLWTPGYKYLFMSLLSILWGLHAQRRNSLMLQAFSNSSAGKEFACHARGTADQGSIPRSGRSPGGGKGNPLQDPCLENPMDRGAWRATVRGVTQSWIQLSAHPHVGVLGLVF